MEAMLYDLPLWCIALGLLLLLLSAALGFAGGRRRVRDVPQDQKDDEGAEFGTIQSAILGLLALLLAFTYSLASGHFDTRKQNVVNEANAIGTAWLRAGLFHEPLRGEVRDLLRRYVDQRLELASAPIVWDRADDARGDSEVTQAKIWEALERAAGDVGGVANGELYALLVEAVNDVIDMHSTRIAGLRDHVPVVVLLLMMFVSIVALGIVGFAAGCRGKRNLVLTGMLSLLIVAVINVTMDLDRPRRGFVTISQQAMLELQASLRDAK